PYNLAVDSYVDGRVRLRFVNLGEAAASFLVTSDADDPRTFTVEPGRSLSGQWDSRLFNLTVHGPNGFLRQFAGDADSRGIEVTGSHHVANGPVRLDLANHGRSTANVEVHDAYTGKTTTIRVRPAERAVHHVHPQPRSGTWYDLSVRLAGDEAYLRRIAG